MLVLQQVRWRGELGRALAGPLGHGLIQLSRRVSVQRTVCRALALLQLGLRRIWLVAKLAAQLPQLLVPVLWYRKVRRQRCLLGLNRHLRVVAGDPAIGAGCQGLLLIGSWARVPRLVQQLLLTCTAMAAS